MEFLREWLIRLKKFVIKKPTIPPPKPVEPPRKDK